MFILIGYVVAKLTGWINTPEWVDLLPFITIIFLTGISYQKILGSIDSLDKKINRRTDYLKDKIDNVGNSLSKIEHKLDDLSN